MSVAIISREHNTVGVHNRFQSPREAALEGLRAPRINARMPEITRRLGAAGISSVYIRYVAHDGQTRSFTSIRYLNSTGDLTKPLLDIPFLSTLYGFFGHLIDHRHPIGKSNAVCGHFIWDLGLDLVHHVHRSR